MDWDLHLADAGYDVLHDYSAWRWIVSAPEFHAVTEGFPRIAAPVPLGVSGRILRPRAVGLRPVPDGLGQRAIKAHRARTSRERS